MGGEINAGADERACSSTGSSSADRLNAERDIRVGIPDCKAPSMAGAMGDSERLGQERSGNGMSSTDSSILYDEASLQDSLRVLSLEVGEERDSAPEGIAAGEKEQRTAILTNENGLLSSPPELSRQTDTNLGDMEYAMQQQQPQQGPVSAYRSNAQVLRGYDPPQQKLHEYRPPPSLQLPDQSMMEHEFGGLHQAGENDFTAPHNFRLPATLAVSPSCHDGKVLLDPNAREFTPSPSPCPSPVLPTTLMHMGVPSPYSIDPGHLYPTGVDSSRIVYGPDYGTGPIIPLYGNGPSLTYAPVSAAPSPAWENLGIPDMGHQVSQSSGAHLPVPPVGLGQPLQQHPVRSWTNPFHTMMSMGLSTTSLSSHPTITGREHVSRAILLNGVPPDMDDVRLKQEMEQWGPVRALGSERRQEGLVTVHYYDLRHAKEALRDIQQQHLNKQQRMQQQFQLSQKQRGGSNSRELTDMAYERQDVSKHSDLLPDNIASSSTPTSTRGLIGGTVMWAQYTVPVGAAAGPDGLNQGTLVVFNLDVETTMEQLKVVFEHHGAVKELRETPAKKQHKFVEFFDVRDAARALKALDGTEIGGKRVKIEFSRPGGQAHKARVQAQQAQTQHQSTVFTSGGSRSSLSGSGPSPVGGQPVFLGWNGEGAGAPPLTMAGSHGGPPYMWANIGSIAGGTPIGQLGPLGMVQPQHWNSGTSPLQSFTYPTMHGGPQSPGQVVVLEPLPFGRPTGRTTIGMSYTGGPASPGESFSSGQGFGRATGGAGGQGRGEGVSSRRKRNAASNGNAGYKSDSSGSGSGGKFSMRDSPRCGKSGLTPKCGSRESVPVQYVFDEGEVQANENSRTTLMIKNIPNKYSQQMLLQLLDQHCTYCNAHLEDPSDPESAYDFVYLPIDFKNRCNLGYAFVNFTTVAATIRLYKAFHAQQWEAFNSRKICHVTYARVQGRAALEEHFKNSRFACDTDDYLPLIFRPPRNGKNSSIPATVAAVHQSSRVLNNSSDDDHGRVPRNGERGVDDYSKRAIANGSSSSGQDLEIEVASGQSRGSTSAAMRSSVSQQQHR